MKTRNIVAACTSVLLALGFVGAGVAAANANTSVLDADHEGYVTAAWLVPGGSGSIWEPDQTLITSADTAAPSLGALDGYAFPECSYIQVDVYHDSTVTDTLLGGTVLHNPNDPAEDLISGGSGTAWKFITTNCPQPFVNASVSGVATCDAATSTYTINWTGTVTGKFNGYVAQRVKYTGSPVFTVADGVAPGTGFTYTTTAPGSATSASAPFHVHVTKTAAGVDPLDTDATGTVALGGDCAPAPQPCVAVGPWYTEDLAPALTDDGYLFTGSTPQPVNYLYVTSGNFQGFAGASVTYKDVAGYHPGYRFVVNPNAGTLHYASVTVEPYINGWVAGQNGPFTITPASLAWSSKILSGPGSQSSPVPLSQFGTIWPNNQFISQGLHLGSTNNADTHALVTSVSGCVNAKFDKEPVSIQFNVVAPEAQCGVDGVLPDLGAVPAGVTRTVSLAGTGPGHYVVTFAALAAFKIVGQSVFNIDVPAALLFQGDNADGDCYVAPREGESDTTSGTPVCGSTTVPTTTVTVAWVLNTLTGVNVEQAPVTTTGTRALTAAEVKAQAATCDKELAFTGVNRGALIGIVVVLVLIIGGVVALFLARSRKNRNES